MGEEPDRAVLEESDDSENSRQSRDAGGEVEEKLPCLINEWVLFSFTLQVGLFEEGPDTEFDDQLRSALKERFEGGNVPQVVIPSLSPAFFSREDLKGDGKTKVLRPHLIFTVWLFVTLILWLT